MMVMVGMRQRNVELEAIGTQSSDGSYNTVRERAAGSREGLRIGCRSTRVGGKWNGSDCYKCPVRCEIEMPGHKGLIVFRGRRAQFEAGISIKGSDHRAGNT